MKACCDVFACSSLEKQLKNATYPKKNVVCVVVLFHGVRSGSIAGRKSFTARIVVVVTKTLAVYNPIKQGQIEIYQKSTVVDPTTAKGPIRLRIPKSSS